MSANCTINTSIYVSAYMNMCIICLRHSLISLECHLHIVRLFNWVYYLSLPMISAIWHTHAQKLIRRYVVCKRYSHIPHLPLDCLTSIIHSIHAMFVILISLVKAQISAVRGCFHLRPSAHPFHSVRLNKIRQLPNDFNFRLLLDIIKNSNIIWWSKKIMQAHIIV